MRRNTPLLFANTPLQAQCRVAPVCFGEKSALRRVQTRNDTCVSVESQLHWARDRALRVLLVVSALSCMYSHSQFYSLLDCTLHSSSLVSCIYRGKGFEGVLLCLFQARIHGCQGLYGLFLESQGHVSEPTAWLTYSRLTLLLGKRFDCCRVLLYNTIGFV